MTGTTRWAAWRTGSTTEGIGVRKGAMATGLVLAAFLTSCGASHGTTPRPSPPTTSSSPTPSPTARTTLTLGVYGTAAEEQAWKSVVAAYMAEHPGVQVDVVSKASHDESIDPIRTGFQAPDVFLAARRDLTWLEQKHISRPLDELLDERGVNFGDDYARDAVEAFSGANALQCMPYSISPLVIYYNTRLIDFDKLLSRGLITSPINKQSWSWDQFAAAARYAARARGTLGVGVTPDLEGLAPYIFSGGGHIVDSQSAPTTTTFSNSTTQAALAKALTVLRDPTVAVSPQDSSEASLVELFKEGKVGMIAGFRSLTPELRDVPGLSFDVMPFPVLSTPATIGDDTGLCLSANSPDAGAAADLIAYLVSDPAESAVTSVGYVVPANLDVLTSRAFLQPDLEPANAQVFADNIRNIDPIMPAMNDPSTLATVVDPGIRGLLTANTLDLPTQTTVIDEEAKALFLRLSPSPSESPSPSDSSSTTPGG